MCLGWKKFHQHLLGSRFTILSDHKLLCHFFSSDEYHPCLPALSSDNECLWLAIEFWLGETVVLMELLQSSSVNVNQIKIMIPSFQKWVISHCTENPLLSAVLEWWKNSMRDIQESCAWSHLFVALCVVMNGPWPGSESEKLSAVSNYKAFSPPPAPLHPGSGLNGGQSPCGLYRPISWKDVPCCPWFSKWKEGSKCSYLCHNHRETESHVCYTWVAREVGLRQWLMFHWSWVTVGYDEKWHWWHQSCALSSSFKWLSWKGVQTFKKACQIWFNPVSTITIFVHYQITLHTTTGISPAEQLMGRRLLTRWDLMLLVIFTQNNKARN